METPQYLRKHLFERMPELQYAGLLPPLRTPHHPLERKTTGLKDGEIREGVAFRKGRKLVVDVGVESPIPLLQSKPTHFPQRLTVKITRNKAEQPVARPISSPRFKQYWGFSVRCLQESLGAFLSNSKKNALIIATSRKGSPLDKKSGQIQKQWKIKQTKT